MRSDRFYLDLPSFSRFDEVADFEAYVPVPDDWVLMITDVVSSTRAIAEGRYKDVNLIGASSIAAILNVAGSLKLPFEFGGDGAVVLVPPSLAEAASATLRGLQVVSRQSFGLALRAAAIPVAALRAEGQDLRVRKYELSPGNFLAMFVGGGIQLAEQLIKSETSSAPFLLQGGEGEAIPDLGGLSCRWDPLVPRNGRMLALILRARNEAPAVKRQTLMRTMDAVARLAGSELKSIAPVSGHSLQFSWPPQRLAAEARLNSSRTPYWLEYGKRLGISLVQWAVQRLNRKIGDFDPVVYRDQLFANTDFRKYDGTLRLVLDVTDEQVARIMDYLDAEYRADRLIYGAHVAERGLMTCLVFSLADNQHIHFVDNADGGFALAAADFKQRSETRMAPPPSEALAGSG
ncbi:DUF3095 domain-containing protein [Rhodoligotrophos defluvii]|uniref:DUF3095 domain-containing protein n=1 Tax=Rhodoligotrophos defluvii TaxID=2561934 RepID=UPI0010C9F755|nr:DUF3095 domain-containing protein [Rhodoligotrophos defluvii]